MDMTEQDWQELKALQARRFKEHLDKMALYRVNKGYYLANKIRIYKTHPRP